MYMGLLWCSLTTEQTTPNVVILNNKNALYYSLSHFGGHWLHLGDSCSGVSQAVAVRLTVGLFVLDAVLMWPKVSSQNDSLVLKASEPGKIDDYEEAILHFLTSCQKSHGLILLQSSILSIGIKSLRLGHYVSTFKAILRALWICFKN